MGGGGIFFKVLGARGIFDEELLFGMYEWAFYK